MLPSQKKLLKKARRLLSPSPEKKHNNDGTLWKDVGGAYFDVRKVGSPKKQVDSTLQVNEKHQQSFLNALIASPMSSSTNARRIKSGQRSPMF